MAINIKGALSAGYTPKDIVDLLAEEGRYNIANARQAGFSDDDILGTLQEGATAGPIEALKGSAKRLISSTRTGLAAPFGAEDAAVAGLERQQAMTERPATMSWDQIKDIADKQGYLAAAKEAVTEVPSAIAAQVPLIGEIAGGARLGAMAGTAAAPFLGPAAPAAPIVGGVLGGIAAPALTYFGSNVERQAAEQLQQGKPIDVNLPAAGGSAVVQGALDRFGLTMGGLGRLVGKAALGTEAAERIAKESLLGATAKGAGKLAAAEIPTEVTQQMLERAQAGLPLTTPDALNEYKDVLYQTTLMAPLGGAARIQERSSAQYDVGQRDAQIAAEQQRMQASKLDEINQARAREQKGIDEANAVNAAQAAANAQRNANLQLGEQGDLGFGTTVEEVAARRGYAEPQQDLFFTPEEAARAAEARPQVAEAPKLTSLTELPSGSQILKTDAIASFGFKPNSLAAKALQQLDFTNPKALETFDAILDKHQDKIKADNEAAIESFKGELNELRRATSDRSAGESADLFGGPVSTEPPAGAGATVGSGVAGDRTSTAGPEVREEAQPAALETKPTEKSIKDMQVGETITSGGNVYRRTEFGFEMVQPEAPASQEVIKEEPITPEPKTTKLIHEPSESKEYSPEELATDTEVKNPNFDLLDKRVADISRIYQEYIPLSEKIDRSKKPRRADVDKLNKLNEELKMNWTYARRAGGNDLWVRKTKLDDLLDAVNFVRTEKNLTALKEHIAKLKNKSAVKPAAVEPAAKPMTPGEKEGLQAAKEFEEAGYEDTDLSQRVEQGEGTTPANIETALSDWYLNPTQAQQVAQIVPTVAELPIDVLNAVKTQAAKRGVAKGAIQAFTHKGKAYLIADRIKPGTERSVFMHEVGAHLGLTQGEVNTISNKINKWASASEGSVEKQVYDAVKQRMSTAGETSNEELVAYTVEEAANRGITPAAVMRAKAAPPNTVAGIIRWLAEKFMQSAKAMFNAITTTPTPQDLIDYVYGSTRKVMREGAVPSDITKTPAFKRWFGDSKVVDDNGEPLVVYHGTRADFAAFSNEPNGGLIGTGHYFSSKPSDPHVDKSGHEGANIMPVYLRIENPIVSTVGHDIPIKWHKNGINDGAIWVNKRDGVTWYVVKDANQIKSAIGNTGSFDPNNPDIRYSRQAVAVSSPTRLDELYAQAGGKHQQAQPKQAPFQDLRNDPSKYLAERKKESSRFLDNIATNWFSSDAALQSAIRKGIASMGKNWDSVKHMLYQASTAQALHGEAVAHQFLELGGISYDPTTYKYVASKGPASWKGIFDSIKEAAAAHGTDFSKMAAYAHQYLVARRLKGLQERNALYEERAQQLERKRDRAAAEKAREQIKVIHLTDEQIEAGLKLGQEVSEMAKIVDQWNTVRKSVLDFAVDSGLYSKEDADALADVMDYVPFYRVEQLEASAGPKEYTRGLLDTAMDKAFKGSTQEVNDVFDNMERWASYVIRKGINNRTAQNLVDVASEAIPDDVQAVAKTARGMRENTVSIWRDGELQKYEFSDPLFVKAFTGIESAAIPALKGWAKMASMLRQNVVLNPLFSLSQLPQDAFGAMFVSGVKHPFSLPLEVMSEFYKTLTKTSTAHEALKTMGVVGVRDYSSEVSRIDAEIAAGLKSPKITDKLLAPLRALSMASDNAVRQAIYNQTLKETGDKAKAVERAFEVINFRRAGASREATILRQTVPFFGAYLQAMNVAAQVIAGEGIAPAQKAEARKVLASTMTKVFVLGLIYASMVEDDDDYKKLDTTVRDHHLVIPGSGGLMIPIRPDVFTLFAKIIPEHMYNLAYGAEDATKAKKALKEGLANAILGPTPLPQAARPILEVATNHDFYTGRPIVGKGMEDLEAKYQYTPNTSEFSKMLGSVTGTSPMNWDHMLRAYFGYTGGMALMASSSLMATAQGRPLPDKSPQDMIASIPGMSTFVSKEFGTRDTSDYYELRDKVDEAVKTLNYRKTYGTKEEVKEYRDENKQLISVKSQVNRINENLGKIRKQERLIIESSMDPAMKEVKLRQLNVRKHSMLKNIDKLRARAGL